MNQQPTGTRHDTPLDLLNEALDLRQLGYNIAAACVGRASLDRHLVALIAEHEPDQSEAKKLRGGAIHQRVLWATLHGHIDYDRQLLKKCLKYAGRAAHGVFVPREKVNIVLLTVTHVLADAAKSEGVTS